MSDRLDDLLSRPLADIPDGGFSATVIARAVAEQSRAVRIEAGTWFLCAMALFALARLTGADLVLAGLLVSASHSAPLLVAAGALALSVAVYQMDEFADRLA